MGQIFNFFNIIFTFPIFNALMVLYRIIGDFGLSIIVLTLVIKLILFPLTLKQLKSMKATQALSRRWQRFARNMRKTRWHKVRQCRNSIKNMASAHWLVAVSHCSCRCPFSSAFSTRSKQF